MLTKGITEQHQIPHEEGSWMQLRALSWTQLEEARQARTRAVLKGLGDWPPGMLEQQRAPHANGTNGATAEAAQAPEADPLLSYDRGTLLRLGIVGWSYDAPVTPENVADLDEQTAEWAARLLVPAARLAGGERLKGSSPSTAP